MGHRSILGALVVLSAVAGVQGALGEGTALKAKWIWHKQASYKDYNDTIVARKSITLSAFSAARILITADTKYRLLVNGKWVNDGPSRNWPNHYQYDVVDLAPYLTKGDNTIEVFAKYYGIGTFHEIPQQAGLIAQIEITPKEGAPLIFGTDATWECSTAPAFVSNAPKRCIQMGPLELYDARKESAEKFSAAAELYDAEGGPWKGLHERDCPLLTKVPFPFKAFREANIVKSDWKCFVFPTGRLLYPGQIEANGKVSMASANATVVDCTNDMTLHIQAPGSTITVNGERAKDGAFSLHKGPNFLFMEVTTYFGHWNKDSAIRFVETGGYVLRNPLDSNTADPWLFAPVEEGKYVNTDYGFDLLKPEEQKAIKSRIENALNKNLDAVKDVESLKSAFGKSIVTLKSSSEVSQDPHWRFTERAVVGSAADNVKNPENLISPDVKETLVNPSPQGDVELVYDLGEENVGYYQFEVDAEAGLALDIAAVEYIAPDGRVQHTGTYRNTMQVVCKEGVNKFTAFDRRAGRYVFITLRNQTRPAKFRYFGLVESTYPVTPIGRFASSDADLNKIWEISARTLKLCMEDTYTDCPLYEQTHWVGDARNESIFGYTAFGANDLGKRCILLTGNSMEKFPIALCQTPSTWDILLPAWSWLWGMSVWENYWYNGDKEFLRQVWPQVVQNIKGTKDLSADRGLFSGPFWNMFDWSGIDDNHRTVLHNSMLAVGAVDDAIKCAQVLGDKDNEKWMTEYRASLVKSINVLWDDKKKSYPDSVYEDGKISDKTSVHTSFLSLLYDIAPAQARPAMLSNIANPPAGMTKVGAPFAIQFLYEALDKVGQQPRIIDSIRENYKPMLAEGATTVWESFATGTTGGNGFPTRSHCHAWSSAPIHFLNRIVLGIIPTEAGGKRFTISPWPCGLTHASGTSAAINGAVDVDWKLDGKNLVVTAKAPQGVALDFKRNDSLKDYKITFNGAPVN